MTDMGLTEYLNKVQRIFDIDMILHKQIDNHGMIDYYTQSDYGYRVFHSTEGSIHMALNFDGRFDKEGYYGQARIVQQHINELRPRWVLELGAGKGFNSIYLAKRNNDVKFIGVDITPIHIAIATSKAEGIANLDFQIANFQNLHLPMDAFELVFEVESICHATDMIQVLSEAYRVLKPGGRFIVIDGYRQPGFDQLDHDVRTAARLVEMTLAVGHPWIVDEWLALAQSIGFDVLKVEDVSEAILPNLMKFQFLARGYFRFPLLSNLLLRVLPSHLVRNSIAGLLMPFTVRAEAQGYYVIILGRK